MSTARKNVRKAVVTAVTGLTTTGTNVTESRVYAEGVDASLSVYTPTDVREEEGATINGADPRELEIKIEARAKASSLIEDVLDTIASEVVAAMFADDTLGGTVDYLQYDSFESELSDDAEKPLGLATLTFSAYYRVALNDPDTKV